MPVVERQWEWHFAASPEALWPLIADTAPHPWVRRLAAYRDQHRTAGDRGDPEPVDGR
jgi:hypothetical protein